jgi:preprotein translocase subunit YajC
METMLLPILMFAALGAMMYFGMRKQKRQAAETAAMQSALTPGTGVMTTSGLHGTVTAVADDTIELEIAPGMRTTWVRAAVRQVGVPGPATEIDEPSSDVIDSTLDARTDGPDVIDAVDDSRRADSTFQTEKKSKDLN